MAAGLADGARGEEAEDSIWYRYGAEGQPEILLYFFWSESCLHCSRARAFLEGHDARPAWLRVRSFEVTGSAENRRLFAALAAALEQEILGVPTFFLCGRMLAGFDDAEGQGAALIALAQACRAELEAELATAVAQQADTKRKADTYRIDTVAEGQAAKSAAVRQAEELEGQLDAQYLAKKAEIEAFETQPVERVMERLGQKLEGVTIDIQPWSDDATPARIRLEQTGGAQ